MANPTDQLNQNLSMTPFNDTSFSIGIFSAAEPGLVWQYHHTSALLTCSTFGGATAIDADSVYRIGSMSKLLTVYLFLILQGDSLRNDPVIDHLPELAGFGGEGHAVPDWSAITVGDIAGQMAGLNRNCRSARSDWWRLHADRPGKMVLSICLLQIIWRFLRRCRNCFPKVTVDDIPICDYVNTNGTFVQCTLDCVIRPHSFFSTTFGSHR